jgi:hypothetical protein
MKILIGIIGILIFFLPNFTFGFDSEVISDVFPNIVSLEGFKLPDSDLSELVGRGFEISVPDEVERGNAKIILWDETRNAVVMKDISTGYGNIQRNTLSILGR